MLLLSAWISLNETRHWKNNSPFRVLTHSIPLFFPSILTSAFLHSVRPRAYPLRFDFSTKRNKNKTSVLPRGLGKKYPPNCWSFCVLRRLERSVTAHPWTHSYVFCSTISSIVACAGSSGHTNVLWFSESTCLCTQIPISSSLLSQITWFLCLTSILKKLVISLIYCCHVLCSLSVCMFMHLRFLIFFIGEFLRGAKIISCI